MPNLRGASPVGRGEGGRRARERGRTPGESAGSAESDRRGGGVMMSRGEPDERNEHGRREAASGLIRGGQERSGPTWAALDRSRPVWAGLGRSGPVWTGQGRSGPVRAGLGDLDQERKGPLVGQERKGPT